MSDTCRYVALLRGINIGGHRLKMAELRERFESFGLAHVTTYIQTGNVLFESSEKNPERLSRRLEQELAAALGYAPAVVVLTPGELAKIVEQNPFSAGELADEVKRSVSYLSAPLADEQKRAVEALHIEGESYYAGERVIYTAFRGPTLESALGKGVLEKTLGVKATVRNWAVTKALAELAAA